MSEPTASSELAADPLTLSYATSSVVSLAESPSAAHYHAAVLCGALPLVAGTVALLGFVATRWEMFALVGGFALVAGLLLFVVGGCDLAAYAWSERRRLGGLHAAVRRRVFLAGALLLSNFPIAFLYAKIALRFSRGSWF